MSTNNNSPWTLKPPPPGEIPQAIEADNYPAVLIALVDLGTQENEYKGAVSYRREIFLVWEIPSANGAVLGKPFAANLSSKSNLTKWLAALAKDGKVPAEGVNMLDLLGKPCLLQVSAQTKQTDKGERTYNSLDSASRLPKGMPIPSATRQPIVVNLDDEIPEWLPRSYGRLLSEIRYESAEKHSTTKAKYEAWKKAPRKQAQGGGAQAVDEVQGVDDEAAF